MANETILKFGVPKMLETNGASIANASVVAATGSYDVAADGDNYPDARFSASFAFSVAPTEGAMLSLYARPTGLVGGGAAQAPEATRPTVFIGSFVVDNVTTPQYATLVARDVPWAAKYYLHNNGTGQSVSAGWQLEVTPFTVAPAE